MNSIEMMMWWWWWEKRWQPFLHHIICGYNHLMSRYVRWSKQHSLTGIKAYFKWILIWSRYAPCTLLTVWLQIKQNDRREKKFIYYTIFMCMKRNANKNVGCKSDVKNIIEIRIAVIRSFCINFYTKPHWILLTLDVTCDKRENKSERKEKQIMVIQWWIKVLVVVLPLLWIFNRYTFSLADR